MAEPVFPLHERCPPVVQDDTDCFGESSDELELRASIHFKDPSPMWWREQGWWFDDGRDSNG